MERVPHLKKHCGKKAVCDQEKEKERKVNAKIFEIREKNSERIKRCNAPKKEKEKRSTATAKRNTNRLARKRGSGGGGSEETRFWENQEEAASSLSAVFWLALMAHAVPGPEPAQDGTRCPSPRAAKRPSSSRTDAHARTTGHRK